MANDAHISMIGNVMGEPRNQQVNGTTVFNMRVAVSTTKKQENSQYPASDLYEVTVWGKAGETLIGRVKAKTQVWVTGDFMVGEPYKDRNGTEHMSLRVTANRVKILSGGNNTYNNNNNNNTSEAVSEEEPPF